MPHELYTVTDSEGKQKVLPSVTEIIGILGNPDLMRWSNWLGRTNRSYDYVMDEAAIKGTVIHALMANIINPKKFPMEAFDLSRENLRIVMDTEMQIRKWIKDKGVKFKPKLMEQPILSQKMGYAGCPDYFGEFIIKETGEHYKDALVDWKSAKKPRPKMFLQLGGYSKLIKEYGYTPKHLIIVNLLPKQSPIITVRSDLEEIAACEEAFDYLRQYYLLWETKGYT